MSRVIAASAIRGAYSIVRQAKEFLNKAIEQKGADHSVEFPNTGYYIPIIYSMTGIAVEKLADFDEVMKEIKSFSTLSSNRNWERKKSCQNITLGKA